MAYTIVDPASLPAERGPHPAASPFDRSLAEPLGVTAFGVYQVELPPGEQTVSHDHLDDGEEDVYAITRGTGWLVVDGAEVPVAAGQFIAVTVGATRHLRAGADGLRLVAVCAAPRG
jgi:uncharacterized cupin superfamily protein